MNMLRVPYDLKKTNYVYMKYFDHSIVYYIFLTKTEGVAIPNRV